MITMIRKHKSIARLARNIIVGLLFIAALWLGLSALFSASPPIHYVTSCSMYPEYSRGDVLLVLPLSPSVTIIGYSGNLAEPQPWAVNYSNKTALLNESISSYCNNSAEQMCRNFYSDASGFLEANGPVTYAYANCKTINSSAAKTEPCVSSVRAGNLTLATTQKPQAIVYSIKVFASAPAIPVIHRAFFGVKDENSNTFYYTKGDSNTLFDSQSKGFFLLNNGPAASSTKVMGVVVAKIPFIGDFFRNYRGIEGCEASQITIS